jgi:hypothetical protein
MVAVATGKIKAKKYTIGTTATRATTGNLIVQFFKHDGIAIMERWDT